MAEPEGPVPLQVDIVSDVVCPWCIIGYLQLQKALGDIELEFNPRLRWHPFELNPQMPTEGQDLREHIQEKYGRDGSGAGGVRERLQALGDTLGFHFDYHEGMRMRNTFAAHQLLHWAGLQDHQTELKLALFEAYFSRREDVSDHAVLVRVAAQVGLDKAEAAQVLEDGRYAGEVRASQQHWLERDVHAVPTFFFQGQYMVPGAQEAETFKRVLRKIHARAAA